MSIESILESDWKVIDDLRSVLLHVKTGAKTFAEPITVAGVLRRKVGVEDLEFAKSLMGRRSAAYHIWREKLGDAPMPKIDDVIEDGASRWTVVFVETLDEAKRYRTLCIKEQ